MFGHDLCTHMDDPNSPQMYVSLEINEDDMKARLEHACGIDTSDTVIVQGGTSCGKSELMGDLVYRIEPKDYSYPQFFTEEPNFLGSKLVQNGKRRKKKKH